MSSGVAIRYPPEPSLPPASTLYPMLLPWPLVVIGRHKGQVLGFHVDTVIRTACYRHVELPREIGIVAVAEDLFSNRPHDLRRVLHLIVTQTGNRAGHDASHVVHAGLEGGQTHLVHLGKDRRHVFDPDLPELYLLARREVQDAVAVGPGDVGQSPQLIRAGLAARYPDADHKEARRGIPQKEAIPFEALDIVLRDRFPSRFGVPGDHLFHFQPVALRLDGLDFVHVPFSNDTR